MSRCSPQTRLSLARGLRELEEYLPVAEEFLRLAGLVATWEEDRALHTMVAADAATALAMADRWDAAGAAYERAVASHAEAPNPSVITHIMCEFAHLVMMAREAEGLEAVLDHLAQADAVVASVPDGREGFAPWFERGTVHYRRARAPAQAERFEGALDEAQAATVAHEQGGEDGEVSREEAVRIGALVKGQGLEHFDEAVARLTTAAARCRKAGIPDAAQILDALREDYISR